jgi:TldD protein
VEQSNGEVIVNTSTNNSGNSSRKISAEKVFHSAVNTPFSPQDIKPFEKEILDNDERIKRLKIAENKILQYTVILEGLAFKWHTTERFAAIINSSGFMNCKSDVTATLSINIKIKIQGQYFDGNSAVTVKNERLNLTVDCIINAINDALIDAQNKINTKTISPGFYNTIFDAGAGAMLFHELIGHLVEADYIHNKHSLFDDSLGQKIASESLTLYDDSTAYGTDFDDEGTPTQNTVLVEKGILKNYLYDRYHSINMNFPSTGNGRRQSFLFLPLPRMSNTIVSTGNYSFCEMLDSLKSGLLVTDPGNGQVNPLTGKYMFTDVYGFFVEKGVKTKPFYNASISGNIKETLQNISMIGSEFKLSTSHTECIKENQILTVGMGQPPARIDKLQFF